MNDSFETITQSADLAEPDEAVEPEWVRPAVEATVTWLLGAFTANTTRNAYATHLGVPREHQRWRSEPRTNRGRRSTGVLVQSFFSWCLTCRTDPFTGLDRDGLRAWIYHARACGDADTTLRSRLGAVLSWYQDMRTRGLTTLTPNDWMTRTDRQRLNLGNTQPAKPTTAVTTKQVRALLVAASVDPTAHRERNRALVSVLATTGLRAAELCALDLDDVHRTGPDGHNPALWVRGKGGKRGWVRLSAAELDLIDAYLPTRITPATGSEIAVAGQVSNREAAEDALFTTATGRRFDTSGITALLRRLCRLLAPTSDSQTIRQAARELAGIAETVHPHQFRHYYAQTAERNGFAATQVKKDLRHSSLTTTQGYLDAGHDLSSSAAGFMSDLVHAGEDLTLLPTVRAHGNTVDNTEEHE